VSRRTRDVAIANSASQGIVGRSLADIRSGRFEQGLAALTAAGAIVTTAEIYFSHDKASFGNKMMWWPIYIVPILVPVGIAAVTSRIVAKTILPLASIVVIVNGIQGTYLHLRGINQKPGGFRNFRYNMEMGPPAFAPALAALIGAMGLLASLLRRGDG
jgi:hypothetical protein